MMLGATMLLAVAGGDVIGDREPPSFAIWDVAAGKVIVEGLAAELKYNGAFVFFSPDDQAILYAGDRGFPDFEGAETVYTLDPWTGDFLQQFTVDKAKSIRSTNLSPDGSQVAAGAFFSDEVWIWDAASGRLIAELSYPGDQMVQYVAWSPDGSKLATAVSAPGVARVWDARTWELLTTIDGHEPPTEVWCVSWSPDGRYLATEGLGSQTSVWRVWQSREELVEYARDCCVFRELAPAERQQFGLGGQ